MDEYVEEGKPNPIIPIEQYKLTLDHVLVTGKGVSKIDPPICLTYSICPSLFEYDKSTIIANMIKEFENKLIFILGGCDDSKRQINY